MRAKFPSTIIAQCTPEGSGAIALLRISGPEALVIATAMSKLSQKNLFLDEVATHTIHPGHVVDAHGQNIDYVLFLVMHGPRTFTGEHVVEISCHNNRFIVQNIINAALQHGARLAQNGEFCRQAVINKKIDIVQAEAINELIHAHTQAALKQSLAQVDGSLSQTITYIEKELVRAIALCQASFEFIDEEDMEFNQEVADIIKNICTTIDKIKISFDQQKQIREGIRIALIGSVNAGKSSLFNALLQKERAIVTDIAGTTRDVVEAGIYKDQAYWTLIDTAGLRHTDNIIEQKGIERSLQEAELADIILLVVDQSRLMHQEEQSAYQDIYNKHHQKIILIHNKADLEAKIKTPILETPLVVSAEKNSHVDQVIQAIEKKAAQQYENASPFLLNKRQYNLLLTVEQKLKDALPLCTGNTPYELLSIHVEQAAAHVSELTGKTISEAAMDQVFREFCVGK